MVTDLGICTRLSANNTSPLISGVDCFTQSLPLRSLNSHIDTTPFYSSTPKARLWTTASNFSHLASRFFACWTTFNTPQWRNLTRRCSFQWRIESHRFPFIPGNLNAFKSFIPGRSSFAYFAQVCDVLRGHFPSIVMWKKLSRSPFLVGSKNYTSAAAFTFNLCHQ